MKFLFAPCGTIVFMSIPLALESKSKEIKSTLKNNYVTCLVNSYFLWLPCNALALSVLPVKYMVYSLFYIGTIC